MNAEATKPSVREQVLADAIPAWSNAAGGPDGGSLGDPHDMYEDETGWPQVRLNSNSADRWLHSDIKNIAYPFNHSTFENIAGYLEAIS